MVIAGRGAGETVGVEEGLGGLNGDGKNKIKKNKTRNYLYILWGNTQT